MCNADERPRKTLHAHVAPVPPPITTHWRHPTTPCERVRASPVTHTSATRPVSTSSTNPLAPSFSACGTNGSARSTAISSRTLSATLDSPNAPVVQASISARREGWLATSALVACPTACPVRAAGPGRGGAGTVVRGPEPRRKPTRGGHGSGRGRGKCTELSDTSTKKRETRPTAKRDPP